MKNLLRFTTIIFVVITLGALLAHLFALPHKINLTKEDYKTVQAIYRGWAWLGIFEIGAIVFTLVWTFVEKKNKNVFRLLLAALLIFLVSITIFFAFTFPANKETLNWTVLPQNWESIRANWEYSHAVRAVLNLVGFTFLIAAILKKQKDRWRH